MGVAARQEPCREKSVAFRYGLDVTRKLQVLASYDRVVPRLLDLGLGKSRLGRRLLSSPRAREWLYYGARRGTGPDVWQLARPGQKVTVIGDAARAGRARDAVDGAFRAALLSE